MPIAGTLIRNVLAVGTGQLFSWVGAAILTIILPRFLGEVDLGKFAFAVSFTMLTGVLVDLGTASYLTREVARQPARAGSLALNAGLMRLPLGVISAVLSVAAVQVLRADETTRLLVYVLAAEVLLGSVGLVAAASLQGLQRMRVVASVTAAVRLGYAGLAALVLIEGAGPVEVAMVSLAATLARNIVLVGWLRRVVEIPSRPDRGECGLVLRGGIPFFVWQAALLVYGQIDMVMLGLFTQDAVVGWYSAAYRVVGIAIFVPAIIATAVFPALAASAHDRRLFDLIARRAIQAIVVLGVPVVLIVVLLADKIIELLQYPPAFRNSIIPMMLLASSYVLSGVDMIIGCALGALDRQRRWALAAIGAAVLNPLANAVAIPYADRAYGNGAIGAAAITTLTEVYLLLAGLAMLPSGVVGRETLTVAGKAVAAAAPAALAVLAARDLPLIAPVILGGLTYAACALLLGAFSMADVRVVHLLLSSRRAASTAVPITARSP